MVDEPGAGQRTGEDPSSSAPHQGHPTDAEPGSGSGGGAALERSPRREGVPRSIALSILILIGSMTLAFGVAVTRGNLDMPLAPSTGNGGVLGAAGTPVPGGAAGPGASFRAGVGSTPVPGPTPSAPAAGSSLGPGASARPTRVPIASRAPTERSRLLTRCPRTPRCFIYVVRAGDNLVSIVNYFGVSYRTVLRMNPRLADPRTIRKGQRILLPPPTR